MQGLFGVCCNPARVEALPILAGPTVQCAALETAPGRPELQDRTVQKTPFEMAGFCPTADSPPTHQAPVAPAVGHLVLPALARRTVPGTPVPNRRHEPCCPSQSHSPPQSASPR